MKDCLYCHKIIKREKTESWKYFLREKKFCNNICYQQFWRENVLPKLPQVGKDKRITFQCGICKKEFRNYESNHRKFCSRKCKNEWIHQNKSGINHYNWQGGITPEINKRCNSSWWKKLRMKVYKRDNFVCRICGIKCTSKNDKTKIQCHHIQKGIHIMKNLITVCLGCHIKLDVNHRFAYIRENYW